MRDKRFGNLPKSGMLLLVLFTCLTLFCMGSSQSESPSEQVAPPQEMTIGTLQDLSQAFVDISASVKPAVVTVSAERVLRQRFSHPFDLPFFEDPFFEFFFGPNQPKGQQPERDFRQRGLGSGVIVSPDGYIITNNHVVQQADTIFVRTIEGNRHTTELIGTDPKSDIAVLKIEAEDLKYLKFGDSDSLRVGEIVLAIGSPMSENLAYSVTQGIVSAKGRSDVGLAEYEDFIQTDAAINPGNSGGPLVNLKGEVVGINTAIYSRTGGFQGIGFAVPSNMTKSIMNSLISEGRVVRGWLGVYVQPVSDQIAEALGLPEPRGALVSEVVPDSPVASSDLEAGDVITEVNGRTVNSPGELQSVIAATTPETEVKLVVIRDGKKRTIRVKLGELPEQATKPAAEAMVQHAGFSAKTLDEKLAEKYGIAGSLEGAVVVEVDPVSNAHRAGLREGDLIVEANRKKISSADALRSVLENLESGDSVLLKIVRDDRNLFVAFKL
jgi:serine protease Do